MKFFILLLLIILNATYWQDMIEQWKHLSDDGLIGRFIIGLVLIISSFIVLFNLDSII